MADIDNDGWLDIYVLNHSQDHVEHSNTLYRNNRNGTFSDITEASGAGSNSTSLAVGFFDFNNDLFPDIYVVNEYQRDELIVNNGDGTFTNLRDEVVIPFGGGMGVDFADYDNDGDLDVCVSNLYRDFCSATTTEIR
ncbi:MAG: VCBS repeat-containing protein [Calditrichae bacterium]|nr:VCBS repeat-containing protein [Calditrichia bacterium]